jgi:hypothetical protein
MSDELSEHRDTLTGTPQGGLLSPLIFNIALGALDEHLTGPWKTGGQMSTPSRRATRRRKGRPYWRIVRYADDFAVPTDGTAQRTDRGPHRVLRLAAIQVPGDSLYWAVDAKLFASRNSYSGLFR